MFAKIAVLALVAACFIANSEAYYVAPYAYPSSYAAAYSPYYYGAYTGYAGYAAYPSYWGWGSNKNGASANEAPKLNIRTSLTNNQ